MGRRCETLEWRESEVVAGGAFEATRRRSAWLAKRVWGGDAIERERRGRGSIRTERKPVLTPASHRPIHSFFIEYDVVHDHCGNLSPLHDKLRPSTRISPEDAFLLRMTRLLSGSSR